MFVSRMPFDELESVALRVAALPEAFHEHREIGRSVRRRAEDADPHFLGGALTPHNRRNHQGRRQQRNRKSQERAYAPG